MRRAYLRDVDLQRGVLAHEDPGRAGVVEMDVGEQQVPQVLELEPALAQGQVCRRSRHDEGPQSKSACPSSVSRR